VRLFPLAVRLLICCAASILAGSQFASADDEKPGTAYLSDSEPRKDSKIQQLGATVFEEEPASDDFLPPPDFPSVTPPRIIPPAPSISQILPGEISLEDDEDPENGHLDMYLLNSEPYRIYHPGETMYSYLPGNGENFGWIDIQSTPYLARGAKSGITGMINLHLLAGPESTPIPPRLWDFLIGYQRRGDFSELLSYDLATSIGVFSDFEDSAKDGIRFPSHAVGMFHFNPDLDFVFGADYIDRDDLPLLPVFGFSIHRQDQPNLRFDLVFPRPRIDVVLDCKRRMYLAAFLDGGSWDIERPDESNDVMTYRDYRAVLGFEYTDQTDGISAVELGYVFERQLLFRTIHTVTDFDDAFVLRFVWRR
ncbi:MAG: hypothetical protein KDA36_12035, partial [Planctomycetaceae bacterium]|nr:hypothetical protein [Planctomycetaceae bacterium]